MYDNPILKCVMRVTVAGALVVVSAVTATAADFARPSAPNEYSPQRSFYVRGDFGIGRHSFGGFSQDDVAANGGSFISQSVGDAMIVGAGIGLQINQRFRLDLTGEYRSTAQIKAMDNVTAELTGPDGSLQANTLYQGNLTSYVGLLNGYFDLFNWRGLTPYIGAGVGFAHHKASDFTTGSSSTFTDAGTGVNPDHASDVSKLQLAVA
jgi:opacity protein-like surface antigen